MTQYRVSTFITVEADNLYEAADKAFIAYENTSPDEYHIVEVGDEDDNYGNATYRVDMTEADKEKARLHYRASKI